MEKQLNLHGTNWRNTTWFTKEYVAKLYDVDVRTIENQVSKNLEEITDNGYTVLNSTALEEFNNLSDGYRNVIKIVADIAARMCILNPYLGKETLQKTPGIVMIDELDLSLHPTWQKRIVRILKELFPRVQFFCATHSPFIVQSLENGELIALDQEIDSPYSGRSIEDIAEDIMQVSTPQYSEKNRKCFKQPKIFQKR